MQATRNSLHISTSRLSVCLCVSVSAMSSSCPRRMLQRLSPICDPLVVAASGHCLSRAVGDVYWRRDTTLWTLIQHSFMSLTYKSKPQPTAASSSPSSPAMKIIFQFPNRCVCQPGRLWLWLWLRLGLGSRPGLGVHCEGASRVRVPRAARERETPTATSTAAQQLHLNWLHESINCSRSIAASLHSVCLPQLPLLPHLPHPLPPPAPLCLCAATDCARHDRGSKIPGIDLVDLRLRHVDDMSASAAVHLPICLWPATRHGPPLLPLPLQHSLRSSPLADCCRLLQLLRVVAFMSWPHFLTNILCCWFFNFSHGYDFVSAPAPASTSSSHCECGCISASASFCLYWFRLVAEAQIV